MQHIVHWAFANAYKTPTNRNSSFPYYAASTLTLEHVKLAEAFLTAELVFMLYTRSRNKIKTKSIQNETITNTIERQKCAHNYSNK